ncbi:MAG: terminase family protein, partial [Candidatus Poribacteria bacterium]
MTEWWPHAGAQTAFMASEADECLFGGAAGPGKSECLIMEATRHVEHPEYRALLLRRTYPELEASLIDRSRKYYPLFGARYNEQRKAWTFPSGARIQFGYLQYERDVHRYQSAEFAFLGFDELTSFTRYQYEYMLSRNRNVVGIPNRIRAATNPGNIGHGWVKARCVDAMPVGEIRWFRRVGEDEERCDPDASGARSRQFIPGALE